MPNVPGLEALQKYRTDIEAGLQQFFTSAPALLGIEQSAHGEQALSRLENYCLRPAKRLRGSLAALAYDDAAGTNKSPIAIQAAVILELMQGYLLIVDDAMDRSALRRGEATIHELYKSDGMNAHDADMIAINTGLLAQHLASLQLATVHVPSEVLVRAMQVMQRNIAVTGFGQLEDIAATLSVGVTEADIIRKYVQKSSFYTFVNPLQLGFTLAGVEDATVFAACEKFGVAAGIAFQLHDDYLGIFGAAADLGKSTLDDLREGKSTLLMHYALAQAEPTDVETLRRSLGDAKATDDDLHAVQAILRSCGAEEYCRSQALKYAQVAQSVLATEAIGSVELQAVLQAVVEYSVTRDK
ncbi:polyprenyl synthetase family protein [Aeromicrobium sp.]|nr:polyprenyl synthetase family protein [Candidatus Saccharibacteria bacterium]